MQIINRRSDFEKALRVNLAFAGDGLTLKDCGGIARGCCYLPRIDAGQRDFLWTRLTLEMDDFEGFVRLSAFATDADVMPGEQVTVEQYLRDPYISMGVKTGALDPLYKKTFVGGDDVLLMLRGRYLYLRIEIVLTDGAPPVLHSVRVRLSGDHMLDYLPAVYARQDADGFLYRYLSLFDSEVKDLEEHIEHFDEFLDPQKTSGELLRMLAGWIGADGEGVSDEQLRLHMKTALHDYEIAQTPAGIRERIRRLTGETPVLVEHFQVEPMQTVGPDTALYRKLFGTEENSFFILLPQTCFATRQAEEEFMQRLTESLPAHVSAELVLLKQGIRLDRHSYVGVNSVIAGRNDAAIDQKAAIAYDTVIGGKLN